MRSSSADMVCGDGVDGVRCVWSERVDLTPNDLAIGRGCECDVKNQRGRLWLDNARVRIV